jgi:hypothetical protein
LQARQNRVKLERKKMRGRRDKEVERNQDDIYRGDKEEWR